MLFLPGAAVSSHGIWPTPSMLLKRTSSFYFFLLATRYAIRQASWLVRYAEVLDSPPIVAQLDRASPSEGEGCPFEPGPAQAAVAQW